MSTTVTLGIELELQNLRFTHYWWPLDHRTHRPTDWEKKFENNRNLHHSIQL